LTDVTILCYNNIEKSDLILSERRSKMTEKSKLRKFYCAECGAQFDTNLELEQHFHAVNTITKGSIYLLLLPDGCTPGRWEAARAFAKAIAELREKCPNKQFQYIPFDHSDGAVNSLLAVALV